MRPFKFFFTVAIGIMILSFIARLVIPALFIAAFLSVIYFIGRKFGTFLRNLTWSEARHSRYAPNYNRYERPRSLNSWNEEFSFNTSRNYQMSDADYRTIKIQ